MDARGLHRVCRQPRAGADRAAARRRARRAVRRDRYGARARRLRRLHPGTRRRRYRPVPRVAGADGARSRVGGVAAGDHGRVLRGLSAGARGPGLPAADSRRGGAPAGDAARSPDAFLAWAESLMQPATPAERARFDVVWRTFETYAAKYDPVFTPAFLTPRTVGWLRLGVGSALTRKVLVRVEGPSAAPGDDVILEAKEVMPLANESCLSVPRNAEVFRVVEGVQQIGRLEHRLLVALPLVPNSEPGATGWWIKTWERTLPGDRDRGPRVGGRTAARWRATWARSWAAPTWRTRRGHSAIRNGWRNSRRSIASSRACARSRTNWPPPSSMPGSTSGTTRRDVVCIYLLP